MHKTGWLILAAVVGAALPLAVGHGCATPGPATATLPSNECPAVATVDARVADPGDPRTDPDYSRGYNNGHRDGRDNADAYQGETVALHRPWWVGYKDGYFQGLSERYDALHCGSGCVGSGSAMPSGWGSGSASAGGGWGSGSGTP